LWYTTASSARFCISYCQGAFSSVLAVLFYLSLSAVVASKFLQQMEILVMLLTTMHKMNGTRLRHTRCRATITKK